MIIKTGITPRIPEQIHGTGEIERFTIAGESLNKRSGAFKLFPDGAYWCMNYKDGEQSKYSAKPSELNRSQLVQLYTPPKKHQDESERYKIKQNIAKQAFQHGESIQRTHPSNHPYLISKGIDGYNLKVLTLLSIEHLKTNESINYLLYQPAKEKSNYTLLQELSWRKNWLMFPIKHQQSICNIQFISPNGKKRFLTGARKKYAYGLIGKWTIEHPLILCEGAIDAFTIWQTCNLPVFWTIDAGNMVHAAQSIINDIGAENTKGVLIAGDNNEVGITAAKQTMNYLSKENIVSKTIIPPYSNSDFNDLFCRYKSNNKGSQYIKETIFEAITLLLKKRAPATNKKGLK